MDKTVKNGRTTAALAGGDLVLASSGPPTRTFRVTAEGWLWLGAAACFWGAGMYKGINLITLLATLMAVVWILNAFLAGRRLRHLRLRYRLEEPLFAETPFALEVEIDNAQAGEQAGVRVECSGLGQHLTWFLPRLAPGERVCFRQQVTLGRRGWYPQARLRVCSGYPFGLAERSVTTPPEQNPLVFPSLGRLHRGQLRHFLLQASPSKGRARGQPCRHPAAQSEFHGLRAFRSGDSPRLIHWRTSARRGELMVREFEETPTDDLVLILDPWVPPEEKQPAGVERPSARDGEDSDPGLPLSGHSRLLEDAISLAATISWEWCRQKGDRFVLAVAGHAPVILDGVTGSSHGLLMMECLAVLTGTPAPDRGLFLNRLTEMPLPPGPILVVSPQPSGLADNLAGRLHRPVASLDVLTGAAYDFLKRDRAPGSGNSPPPQASAGTRAGGTGLGPTVERTPGHAT